MSGHTCKPRKPIIAILKFRKTSWSKNGKNPQEEGFMYMSTHVFCKMNMYRF
jgi:hypothetical protein